MSLIVLNINIDDNNLIDHSVYLVGMETHFHKMTYNTSNV